MTFEEAYRLGTYQLKTNGIENAEFDSSQMFCKAFGFKKDKLAVKGNEKADDRALKEYSIMTKLRIKHEPLQYILGFWEFYSLSFDLGPGVLIPRPETELLVDYSLDFIRKNNSKTVFDLCAGSGCIGISIAKNAPETEVLMFEKSPVAFEYLLKNIEKNNVNNVKAYNIDIFEEHDFGKADVLVSNPPYIRNDEIDSLQEEVKREPHSALFAGNDGLEFYREIFKNWTSCLNDNGFIALECGEDQGNSVKDMFGSIYDNVVIKKDYAGLVRNVLIYSDDKLKKC